MRICTLHRKTHDDVIVIYDIPNSSICPLCDAERQIKDWKNQEATRINKRVNN